MDTYAADVAELTQALDLKNCDTTLATQPVVAKLSVMLQNMARAV